MEVNRPHEALSAVRGKPVAFGLKTKVYYDGLSDNEVPLSGCVVSFSVGEYIHVYDEFNEYWWIGRIVKEGSPLVFIPSPAWLKTLFKKSSARKVLAVLHEDGRVDGAIGSAAVHMVADALGNMTICPQKDGMQVFISEEACGVMSPYEVVPVMRPVVFMGPSVNGSMQSTCLMRSFLGNIKAKFHDRSLFARANSDLSLDLKSRIEYFGGHGLFEYYSNWRPTTTSAEDGRKAEQEIAMIFTLSRAMDLLIVGCSKAKDPRQLENSSLAPILIGLKVENRATSEILSATTEEGRRLRTQMGLYDSLSLREEDYDLAVTASSIKEASDKVVDYLESYWKATRVPKQSQSMHG